jgi:hypothetical protein
MKKGVILLLIAILSTSVCFAQERRDNWRRPYTNIGFISTTMSSSDMPDLMSNYGVSFSVGRTFYLHSKPMLGLARLGIDVTWFDVNYTNYQIMNMAYAANSTSMYEQVELGAQIGPSLTIRPFGRFHIHGYIKYAPTISSLDIDGNIFGCYAPFIIQGAAVSVGNIGFGVENRSFKCKYQELGVKDNPEEIEPTTFEGWRAYITFVF